jgi:hypothetical protein
VLAIDRGILKAFLLGREPIRDFPESNGHGRAAPSTPPGPGLGNLILKTTQSFSPQELKKKMLDLCRQQSKPYGYVVKTFGQSFEPRLLYRIWVADGHEELVRGATFEDLDTREMRNDLIAVGNDFLVSNRWGGSPVSVVNPSFLFDELGVRRADLSKDKLPEYPPPALSTPR